MVALTFFADVINALLTLLLGYLLYALFGKAKYSIAIRLISVALSAVLFLLSLHLTDTGFVRFSVLAVLTFSITFLFELKTFHRIIYSIIYISLCVLSEGITAICFSAILNIDMNHSKEGMFYVLGTLISKLIVLIVFVLIRMKRHSSLIGVSFKHILPLLITPLTTLVILVLQYNYNFIISIPSAWAWVLSVAYLLLVLSNIAVFDYIDSLYQNAVDREKLAVTAQIIKEQEKQYQTIAQHYSDIATFRHNQKNINIGILNELRENRIESAIKHLQESISILSAENIRSAGIIYSVVDIKSQEANTHGIEFRFEYQALQKVSVSDIDIAVLLGNALDNAIEANTEVDQSKRYIELLVTVRNNNLIIYIKNPVKESTGINIQNLISKKIAPGHGFGIISMKQIIKKFKGDIVFDCQDDAFEVNIVIPNIVQVPFGND